MRNKDFWALFEEKSLAVLLVFKKPTAPPPPACLSSRLGRRLRGSGWTTEGKHAGEGKNTGLHQTKRGKCMALFRALSGGPLSGMGKGSEVF